MASWKAVVSTATMTMRADTRSSLMKYLRRWNSTLTRGIPTANEVVARVRKALVKLLQETCGFEDSYICIVGHGRINRLLLASLLYADATKFGHIDQGNTAISVVDYDAMIGEDGTGGWSEVVLNYCAHTEDKGAASGGCY